MRLQFLSLFFSDGFDILSYVYKIIFLKLLHFFNLLIFLHVYRVKHCREPAKVREITAALFASSAFKNQNWRKRKNISWDGRIQRTNSRSMTSWFWARCKETWWDFDEVVHMHMMGELLISNSWPGLYNTVLPLPIIGHIWFKWKLGVFKCGQRIIQDLLYLILYTARFAKIIQPRAI